VTPSPTETRLREIAERSGAPHLLNMFFALRLERPVDEDRLRRAVELLVRRHRPLRGEGSAAPDWSTVRTGGGRAAAATLAETARRHRREPIDLDRRGALRTSLVRTDAGDVLFLTFHHARLDGWSLGLVAGELSALYDGEAPPPPDYEAPETRAAIAAPVDGHGAALWWRQYLAAWPAATRARFLREPAAGPCLLHRRVVALDPDVMARLKTGQRQRGGSLYAILLGALAVSVSHVSGEPDVLLATLISGRTAPAAGAVVGALYDAVPVGAACGADMPFRDLVDALVRDLSAAIDHREPYAEIVRDEPAGRPSVVLQIDRYPLAGLRFGAGTATPMALTAQPIGGDAAALEPEIEAVSVADLTVFVREWEGRYSLSMFTAPDGPWSGSGPAVLAGFLAVLRHVAADADATLEDLAVLLGEATAITESPTAVRETSGPIVPVEHLSPVPIPVAAAVRRPPVQERAS